MTRTKDDFLNYARSSGTVIGAGIESNNSSDSIGNETVSTNVWRTNEDDDLSITESVGTAEDIQRSSGFFTGQQQGLTGGTYGGDTGSYGLTDTTGYDDVEIRDSDRSTYQSSSTVYKPVTRRTVTKRTTKFDKIVQKVTGNQLPSGKTNKVTKQIGKVLTTGEITKYKTTLIQILLWSSENLDTGIVAITKGHKEIEIWSDISYVDAEILVDSVLDAGQKSQWVAQEVRLVIDHYKKAKALIIVVPRLYKTIMHVVTNGIDLRL